MTRPKSTVEIGKSLDFKNPEELSQLRRDLNSFKVCRTSFQFLNDHYGLRPGHIHLVLSTTGAGKSSLIRGVLNDLLIAGVETFFYSTEETLSEAKLNLADSGVMPDNIRYMRFLHDEDVTEIVGDSFALYKQYLEMAVTERANKVFIFDNLTTCPFYTDINTNQEFCQFLIDLVRRHQIAGVFIAHTASNVRQSQFEIDAQDIRGGKTLANRAEQVYSLRTFPDRDELTGRQTVKAFLHTLKNRFHGNSGNFYELTYSRHNRMYIGDKRIERVNYEEFYAKYSKARTGKK